MSGAKDSLFSCFQFQDIPGKGCFYIFIPTALYSIQGSGTPLWWFSFSKRRVLDSFIFDVHCEFHHFNILHVFNIKKNNLELRRVKMFVFFDVALKSNLWTCTDDAAMAVSGCGAPPVNFTDLGGRSNSSWLS